MVVSCRQLLFMSTAPQSSQRRRPTNNLFSDEAQQQLNTQEQQQQQQQHNNTIHHSSSSRQHMNIQGTPAAHLKSQHQQIRTIKCTQTIAASLYLLADKASAAATEHRALLCTLSSHPTKAWSSCKDRIVPSPTAVQTVLITRAPTNPITDNIVHH